jgi:hypothetical protein
VTFAFRARNLGPLREIDWKIPEGVSVVVGPNGVGKSTLLRLPEFARIAMSLGPAAAVNEVFGGTAFLKHHGARENDDICFGYSLDTYDWNVTLEIAGGTLRERPAEELAIDGKTVLRRSSGSHELVTADGQRAVWGKHLIPAGAVERLSPVNPQFNDESLQPQAEDLVKPIPLAHARVAWILGALPYFAQSYRSFTYNVAHIAKYGSAQSSETRLERTGDNVFPLLRNWRDRSDSRPRAEFVLSTMREAFPHLQGLDFEVAGQTVSASVVDSRYGGKKTPIARESTGFLMALLHLCAVASGDVVGDGLVTIDEIETSLHPRAIKVLIAAFRRWAKQHKLSIVLATQSETVLDQFQDDPSKIFVLEPNMAPGPKSLTEMYSPEWLSQFSVGDLFGHLEYGSGNQE